MMLMGQLYVETALTIEMDLLSPVIEYAYGHNHDSKFGIEKSNRDARNSLGILR